MDSLRNKLKKILNPNNKRIETWLKVSTFIDTQLPQRREYFSKHVLYIKVV